MSRYCVIGAGPAGLATARALKRAGLSFDLLERLPGLGGIWDISNPTSPIYENTHLISSARRSDFPGFAMPADYPDYPRHDQVLAYLRAFAEEFGLTERIEFETAVEEVSPDGEGWAVRVAGARPRRYDGVVVATGHNWQPRLPRYPGRFGGEVLHSKEYRAPRDMEGKRVLVVGGGNSACDIACDILEAAASVTVSLRRGYHFLPKYVFGLPTDEVAQSGSVSPLALAMLHDELRRRLERHGVPRPDHRPSEANPVVNTRIIEAIVGDEVTIAPDVECFDGERVRFLDGSEAIFDAIVFATGYRHEVPTLAGWLPWRNGRPLLTLNMFPRDRDGLAVMGLFETNGSAFPIVAAQADLAVSAFRSGPGAARRLAALTSSSPGDGRNYVRSGRHLIAVDRADYLDEVARAQEALA